MNILKGYKMSVNHDGADRGGAYVVGALRNLVSAVTLLAVYPKETESPGYALMHDLAGLSLLRLRSMINDTEYECRKEALMKKYGK